MNADRFIENKKELKEKLGNEYPTCREELTGKFLIRFGEYVPGPNEEDFEDFSEYENAKYASEQWAYFCKLSEAVIALESDGDAGKAAWEKYLDWVTENYFPEFT